MTHVQHFEPGTWVWIHDENERYLPAKVLKTFAKGEPTTVRTEDGENHSLTPQQTSLCEECNPEALDSSIQDLVNISDLNEMSILHNLRIRFKEDKIYTYISSILISVNPFKLLPLYTPAILESYRNGSRDKPPHVFAAAYNAYNNMLNESEDQAMVCSGESGAGKSEATKLILQFLTDVSHKAALNDATPEAVTTAAASTSRLEAQILAANPILEAFGNAKTLRNNNSSRFGKLITVNFDQKGAIVGGGIINYLLEKSRVVFQTPGERNYHIFYQLLSAADYDQALTNTLKLQAPELFNYTSQSGVTHVEGISDDKDFEEMKSSMSVLKFSSETQLEIFKIVAGVLHFGNLKFKVEKRSTEEDGSSIMNLDVLEYASSLWGCDPEKMQKFLTCKNIGSREVIIVGYNINQAQDARDAMVKKVYAELFQFIVDQINLQLSTGLLRHKFIGVLDIFGFESFQVNSFEQLCINYCNEKLQFHFNEHIFRMEQTLYQAEGIHIPGTAFVDNQPTLDLLEMKTVGVFSMIDEEINVPRGSDEGFLQKVLTKHADGKAPNVAHPNMIRPKANNVKDFLKNFGVLHYAGPVFYNVTGFLDKNKDQLHSDIIGVLQSSSSALIKKFFATDAAASEVGKGGKGTAANSKKTLGSQFKTQLSDLVATLNAAFPHFVRCMKSNDLKQGNVFNSQRMQDQLRYAGLVEVCRIRKLGYPVRRPFIEFYKRYRPIDLTCSDLDSLTASLSKKGVLKNGEWAKGNSRIFMRTPQSVELEIAREISLVGITVLIQKHGRKMIGKRRLAYFKKLLADLQAAINLREEKNLSSVIEACFELPYNGNHLGIMKQAKELLARIVEEKRVNKLLENAIMTKDINSLKNAIEIHRTMSPPFDTPLAAKAKDVLRRLEEELALKNALTASIAARDRNKLQELVDKAASMQFDSSEVSQAKAVIIRLDQETALLARLTAVMQSEQLDELNAVYSECVSQGMESYYSKELKKAKELMEVLVAREIAKEAERKRREEEEERQRKALAEIEAKRNAQINQARALLVDAIASKDVSKLNSALQQAIQMGVQIPEVDEARLVMENQKSLEQNKAQLSAAINSLTVRRETGINEQDLQPLIHAVNAAEKIAKTIGEYEELLDAREQLQTFQKYASAKTDLEAAVASKDRVKLRAALDIAEDLDLQIDIAKKARSILKELEAQSRQVASSTSAATAPSSTPAAASSSPAQAQPQQYDAAEEARKIRQEVAKQARFDVKNFPNLRSADDYARGAILNKAKIKEQFLTFQNTVIPKSLTDLNKDSNKLAIQIHKDLLGYMGDKQLPFPAMLAQDILRKGYEYKPIRDEIYLLIIKQLSSNPRPESVAKGWQVMCMCVGTFPPSTEFENFLLHYIIEKRDKGRGAVVDYARYCLRTLEAMLNSGDGTGFIPTVEEILAYKERPPILATIYLVDGNVITENLPLTPDLNVGKVIEMCSGWLDLKDSRINTLGMFVYDMGEIEDGKGQDASQPKPQYVDLKRTPRPLRNEDFMGDTIVQKARQRRKFKFVLKRKVFLPKYNYRGDDPFFERMTYLQAEDEVIIQGNIEIPSVDEAVQLAAISMAVVFGVEMPDSVDGMIESSVTDFMPPDWRNTKPARSWAEQILQYRNTLVDFEPDDLQDKFLQITQKHPMYGSHWFYAHRVEPQSTAGIPKAILQLPRDIMLAFNADGLHIFDFNRRLLLKFPYSDICRWGGSSSQFSLIMSDDASNDSYEFVLVTAQAADMAAIILDHIRAIMAEQELEG